MAKHTYDISENRQDFDLIVHINKTLSKNVILNEVQFGVKQGEKLAIIGPNGGGKSTLLKVIAETLNNDNGCIVYEGENITQNKEYHKKL